MRLILGTVEKPLQHLSASRAVSDGPGAIDAEIWRIQDELNSRLVQLAQ